jgi:hypothetical protein
MRGRRAAILSLAVVACARPLDPPGGPEDLAPPQVIAIEPAPFSVVPGYRGAVVFRFDERISERNVEDAVVVSPITGEVRARHGRSSVAVEVAGGWRPGVVYRVALRPRIGDLFGNVMTEPAEAIFSTGPEIPDGALAGIITDRLTGQPVSGARVEAREQDTELIHLAITDESGYFDMPTLPAGTFAVTAYIDQSRNRRLDPFEPRAETVIELGAADTAVAALAVLAPDTTPARLVSADPIDTTGVRLTFDDHLDPDWPASGARVVLAPADTAPGQPAAGVPVDSVRHPWQLPVRQPVAATDTAAGAAQADTLAPQRRTGPAAADTAAAPATGPLPSRDLIVWTRYPLQPGVAYRVWVEAVVNVAGLPEGGGTAVFVVPLPPPPPPPPEPDEEAVADDDAGDEPVEDDAGEDEPAADRPVGS